MSADDTLRRSIIDALVAKHGGRCEVRVSEHRGTWSALAHIETAVARGFWGTREKHPRKRDALHALARACGVEAAISGGDRG